jgi:hypothetical protein
MNLAGGGPCFFESPRPAAIRDQAGVKSPEFIYLDQLESGSLR